MRRSAAAGAALLALALAAAPCAAAPQRFVDYLHIEANEGSSSGGHVALRLGERTFHFQYHDGTLRLARDDSAAFLHTYAGLQNRDVHVSRVAVSEETWSLLRRHFNDRYLLEARQFAALEALRRDRDVLATLLGGARDDTDPNGTAARATTPGVSLRGAGFFADSPDAVPLPDASALAELRRSAEARHGERVLERRRSEALAALETLRPEPPRALPDIGPHRYVEAPPSYARRATELLENATAAEMIAQPRPLRSGALRDVALAELELAPDEAAALDAFASRLRARLADLPASTRPDWGRPLLLGMARLAALERSTAAGRLVVLDAFPDDAARIGRDDVARNADLLPRLLADARSDLDAARAPLRRGAALTEADYTALETAANRFLELQAALRGGDPIRIARGPLLPARAAERALPRPAGASRAELRASLAGLEAREAAWASEVARLYRYDLVERNCVSEIFREIEAAFAAAAPGAEPCAESERRLGGCIDPDAGFSFIPFASARAVAETWSVTESRTLPSYRNERLAELAQEESSLATFWRESNVLTSTVYRRNPDDSAFLFFAEDAVLARPLFGAANLVAGLGASAAGLFLLPAGDPDLLAAGLWGAFFSVPELAFVSLRKGSFAWVPRREELDP